MPDVVCHAPLPSSTVRHSELICYHVGTHVCRSRTSTDPNVRREAQDPKPADVATASMSRRFRSIPAWEEGQFTPASLSAQARAGRRGRRV